MLNTADDPIDFLKREAEYTGLEVVDAITLSTRYNDEPWALIAHRYARRAWRFALAAQALESDNILDDAMRRWRERRPPIPPDTPRAACGGTHAGPCNSACAEWP